MLGTRSVSVSWLRRDITEFRLAVAPVAIGVPVTLAQHFDFHRQQLTPRGAFRG